MSYKLEYIWLDGYTPEPSLRSKTKIVDDEPDSPADCPDWAFDGSSTEQAEGHSSDCLLKPVRIVPDPDRRDGSLVLCEVLNADGSTHASNIRGTFEDDGDFWFGPAKFFAALATSASGIPGGIFAPSLAAGAVFVALVPLPVIGLP